MFRRVKSFPSAEESSARTGNIAGTGRRSGPLPFAGNGLGGQTTTKGVVMYESEDLYHWKYEGVILACSQGPESPLYAPMRFERPKIVYNRAAGGGGPGEA